MSVIVNREYSGYTAYNNFMPSEKPFLSFVIDPELLKKVSDFQHKHQFASRAAAIKWLLGWALKQKPVPAEAE